MTFSRNTHNFSNLLRNYAVMLPKFLEKNIFWNPVILWLNHPNLKRNGQKFMEREFFQKSGVLHVFATLKRKFICFTPYFFACHSTILISKTPTCGGHYSPPCPQFLSPFESVKSWVFCNFLLLIKIFKWKIGCEKQFFLWKQFCVSVSLQQKFYSPKNFLLSLQPCHFHRFYHNNNFFYSFIVNCTFTWGF